MAVPYDLWVEFSPLRLKKGDDRPVEMRILLKNVDSEENLTSLVVDIPDKIGFDKTGIVSRKEIRIGKLNPGEEKEIKVDLYATPKTEPGVYKIRLTANKHYRGYTHIIDNAQREVSIRVV